MKIQPLGLFVIVKEEEHVVDEKTAGGLFIPQQVLDQRKKFDMQYVKAKVIAVGPGEWINGQFVKPDVNVDDEIVYSRLMAAKVEVDFGESDGAGNTIKYWMLKSYEIMGKLVKDEEG